MAPRCRHVTVFSYRRRAFPFAITWSNTSRVRATLLASEMTRSKPWDNSSSQRYSLHERLKRENGNNRIEARTLLVRRFRGAFDIVKLCTLDAVYWSITQFARPCASCKKSYLRNSAMCNKRLRGSSIFLAIPITSKLLQRPLRPWLRRETCPLVEEMLFRELLASLYKIQNKTGWGKHGL